MTFNRRAFLASALGLGALALAGARPGRALAQDATPAALPVAPTPAAEALDWLLERLHAGGPSDADVIERFAPDYLTAYPSGSLVPTADVVGRVGALAQALGPAVLAGYLAPPEQTGPQAYGLVSAGDDLYLMIVSVEPDPPHRILDDLTLPIAADVLANPPGPPADWAEFDRRLAAYAPRASALAAEVVGGELRPIHALDPDRPLAVGSSYKLYVLGELGRRVGAREMAWDDRLAIRDDWKSLPAQPLADTMSYEPAGTEHTLRDYAERMIAISGNTAADHLLFHLGRERVEAALAALGNAHADRNAPLPATREVFALNLVMAPDRVAAYVAADADGRRALLDAEVRPTDVAPAQAIDWVAPRHLETVGWFASTADLCRALVALWDQGGEPGQEPIRDILASNPGVDPSLIDPAAWASVAHKGGALPGGLNRAWLLERADGRRFAFAVTLNDPADPLDLLTPDLLFAGAFGLLAAWQGPGAGATPIATPAG